MREDEQVSDQEKSENSGNLKSYNTGGGEIRKCAKVWLIFIHQPIFNQKKEEAA